MKQRCTLWRIEKSARGPERTATAQRTWAEAQNLKQGQFADSVSEDHPVGCESRRYPADLAVFKEFKQNSRISPTLRNDDLESLTSFLVSLLGSTFIPKQHQENLFFTV